MTSFSDNTRAGFTLMEIVLTLTIMSLVGTIFVAHADLTSSLPDTRVRLGEMRAFVLARVSHAQNEALFNGTGCSLMFGKTSLTTVANVGNEGVNVKCSLLEGEGESAAYPEGVTLSGDSATVAIDADGIIANPPTLTFKSAGDNEEKVRLTTGVKVSAGEGSGS